MAKLILGPLLRYVGETEAVVWVETDEPCEVEILGHSAPTFCVHGHHYVLVIVDGLEPGSTQEYEVALDGVRRWPEPDSEFPPSVIRTLGGEGPLRLCFGSCRVSLPHHSPYTHPKDDYPEAREFDALFSLTQEMCEEPPERWPQALMLLGDQVYADEVSPETLAFIKKRRDVRKPPGEEVADFEEFTRLYQESWSDPAIRWLYSTVSCSMVVDDHDINDDWNISAAWVKEMNEVDWWPERERSGLAAYWLYQFIGNLSPELLRESELLAKVREADDGWGILRRSPTTSGDAATGRAGATAATSGARGCWSSTRAAVGCSRRAAARCSTKVNGNGSSATSRASTTTSSSLHRTRSCSPPDFITSSAGEAICAGAWGERAAERGDPAPDARLRPLGGVRRVVRASGRAHRGAGLGPLRTRAGVDHSALGDVHHAYVAEVAFKRSAGVTSAVHQAVCSPFRNALDDRERQVIEAGNSSAGLRWAERSPASPACGPSRSAGGWSRARSTTTRSRR